MYVGRIVAIGKTKANRLAAMYRVSSRSFPNRQAIWNGKSVSVVPREGHESDIYKNPYIAYNCLRLAPPYAVIANGSHTDPIAEKLESGMRMRDALAVVLGGLDYEHDDYQTPRIAAVADGKTKLGILGIIRSDAILIREFALQEGEALYLATYEHNIPDEKFRDRQFHVEDAEGACDYILGKGVFAELERPVLAACAVETGEGFAVACKTAGGKA
jgi:IMP cyclohydrolase